MNILGISCYYHDSAASLLMDGKIKAAAEEERFNREKHSSKFPTRAIDFCLQRGNITIRDIDYVGFYEKPFLKFERFIVNHLRSYPYSIRNFIRETPQWLDKRLTIPIKLENEIGYEGDTLFIKHHLSHA
ncbi:MAG: carbamoyltransferase N-terminal domain-containing protein, partial [Candidatus Aenigmatarchaeota archaeon]